MVLCSHRKAAGRKLSVQAVSGKRKFPGVRLHRRGFVGESNHVALKSAVEDFESTTLCAIPGLLAKLHYIAGLHDGRGNYLHWGMGRTHGEEAAQRAIRASHAAVLTQVLRTPLRDLDEDLRRSASGRQLTAEAFLASLQKRARQALPERALPAAERHFNSVLDALSALLESPERANRPDASLPPPLAR